MAALLVSAAKVNADLVGAFIILPSREPGFPPHAGEADREAVAGLSDSGA